MKTRTVHLSVYASQPNVQILCDDSWTSPRWRSTESDLPDGVYDSDDNKLYTFDEKKNTCDLCYNKLRKLNRLPDMSGSM